MDADSGGVTAALFVCAVEGTAFLGGRMLVVYPGVPADLAVPLRIGDLLHLCRPDGSMLVTPIRGFEMISGAPRIRPAVPFGLGPDVKPEMVPIGTTVWVGENVQTRAAPRGIG